MPNTIRLRRGSTAPSAGSFQVGEPAWDSTNSRLYVKNAAGAMVQIGGGGTFTSSTTAPGSPVEGDEWLDENTGILYVYVTDANTSQWVELGSGVLGPAGVGLSDGDKGDITVSASGATWTIDAGVVDTTNLGGDITTAGKALLDDADATAQRATLGLGMFTPAESTAAPNATVPVESWTATNAAADVDIALAAKGQGATLAQVPDNGTGGGDKRGIFATDWQKSRTGNSQVASGSHSTICGGRANTASGLDSVIAGGAFNVASQQYASILGGIDNAANAFASTVLGRRGTSRSIVGNMVFAAGSIPIANTTGASQAALLILGVQTADATATVLRSNSSAADATNQLVLANNAASYVRGSIIANVTGGGNTKAWTFEGAIKRGANAASTAIVGTFSVNVIAQDAGASAWTIALSADTTNGGLQVQVTGQAATTIRWVCKLETTEVTF